MLFINILLLILRIIGIIILAILGIVVVLLCLILFVPIRYKVHAEYRGTPRVSAHITYLLRLLHLQFELNGKQSELRLKLLGFNLSKNGRESRREDGEKVKSKREVKNREVEENPAEDNAGADTSISARNKNTPEKTLEKNQKASDKALKENKKIKKKNKKSKNENTKSESDGIIGSIKDAVELLKENRQILSFLLKQLKLLFRHILPGSHVVSMRLGLDDPALLGEIIGAAAVIRAATGLVIRLTPVWDEAVFEAEVDFKGRIILGRLLFIAAGVYFNKDVRKLVKALKS